MAAFELFLPLQSAFAFQQFRYLDVFGNDGVKAPAGDQTNVRAEFTQMSGGSANLIGFCTVQDNTSFGADFRIAKSFGSPTGSLFAQGGNAFGATALLGTTDNRPLTVLVNNRPALRIPTADFFYGYNSNVIGGKRAIRWRPAWEARRLGAAVAILLRADCVWWVR